ncbi:MAG TPA: glycosyltransferase [Gammaproteobacteria bacterium]|nr:glycosyltransferase [Gammaproteobacteria bacterium]
MRLIAIAIGIAILSAIATPIYKDYLAQTRIVQAVTLLSSCSANAMQQNAEQNWPPSNISAPLVSTQSLYIPRELHLIWIGGNMPKDYLANLQHLASLCENIQPVYEVNIWTDAGSRQANAAQFKQIAGLTVRHIEGELLKNLLSNDSPYTDIEKKHFLKWMLFEYLAPANYAAVSDLLRIEILRQHGGLYLDTDTFITSTITEKKFAATLRSMFANVAANGGFSCRKNGYNTNNNIIIASNNPIIAKRLKALVQYMIMSMSDEHLTLTANYFTNSRNYLIAKKSPIRLQSIDKLTPSDAPAIRVLTLAQGPHKLASFAVQWLPNNPAYTNGVTLGFPKPYAGSAPGVLEMEQLFDCYRYDNIWLDKSAKTTAETEMIINNVNAQVKFYLENIQAKDLHTLLTDLQNQLHRNFTNLNLTEMLPG